MFRKCKQTDGIASIVEGIQLYSDKSQIFLRSGSLAFYPLHITLLNVSEEFCESHIVKSKTVFAYLPVTFEASHTGNSSGNFLQYKHNSNINFLKTIHESITFSLENIRQTALVGIDCKTTDGHEIGFYFIILSYNYVADILEREDMLSFKRRSRSSLPCHDFLVLKET